MRVLCCVNHFFGESPGFRGKSTTAANSRRGEIVARCLDQLKSLPNIEVRVCGIDGYSLVPIDVSFPHVREDPTFLIYESLEYMAGHVDEFDYFLNVEDDIFVPAEVIANAVDFDRCSLVNEVLHPNRVEIGANGERYCVDLRGSLGQWTFQRKVYAGRELRVALNPHSAMLLLSRGKLRYCLGTIDTGYRGVFLGHAMESAFAHYLSPFCLYRSYDDLDFHYVIHLDHFDPPAPPLRARVASLAQQCLPPVLVGVLKRIRSRFRGSGGGSKASGPIAQVVRAHP